MLWIRWLAVFTLVVHCPISYGSESSGPTDAVAQFNLGTMYANGEGVQKNAAEAIKWYRRAAEQGVAEASFNLGVIYGTGDGVPENDAEAFKWYRRAAEGGLAVAQLKLGLIYALGDEGVPENDAEAFKWYRRAAEQGDARAQYFLGVAYYLGQGVPENSAEGYFWLSVAAATLPEHRDQRDTVRSELTPHQIADVQARTAKWKPKG